ncbi:hypothetical protein WA026_018130 [Henosepilachna vigintioctopunctata]|uniref:ATP-dependent RNA helicase n=1 Tax=Henosepilachna vigintioctopunctata TaxID=420089 RepID=A0AAW1UE48_9CUCU
MSNDKKKDKKVKFPRKKKYNGKPETEIIKELQAKYDDKIDLETIKTFVDFPLSPNTIKGLKASGYSKPTDIQKESLMLALAGKDILGAAQTGSGKTLAFIIPILEKLFCKQWTHLDGLGALVITPTRELAYQIFETLRRVGVHHNFSAGLIIGGKDLKFERKRIDQCNIMISTPGRLLQHMDENPLFDAVNLQILVLDEADRCLDMGFQQTMNAIIAHLPVKRQTMLFSATQTKSVKDLARLSLKDPCYISVHENAKHSTPPGLRQSYVVCELKDKISILWSFIKTHLKQKCIIFMSSCKQVKYIFEIFSKLRPGISLSALYGTLHQMRRMEIYESFVRKSSAVLFATDLAARGLDFPEVHWVVQVDCPEDSATYIHRVGRTARYHKDGESLLLLMKSELKMLDELQTRKIPIEEIDINPKRLNNPVRKMEAYLCSNPSLKESAQRAFVAYAKSVYLMKNKKVFNVETLDTDSFAHSLGLAIPPRIRFLQRMKSKQNNDSISDKTNKVSTNKKYFDTDEEDEGLSDEIESAKDQTSDKVDEINNSEESHCEVDDDVDSMQSDNDFNANQEMDVKSNHGFNVNEDSEDDDIYTVKRKNHDIDKSKKIKSDQIDSYSDEQPVTKETIHQDVMPEHIKFDEHNSYSRIKKKPTTKAALAKKILKHNIVVNKKITFDNTGEAVLQSTKEKKSEIAQEYENECLGGIDIEKAKLVLQQEDVFDRQLFREKVKAKHKEEKRKLKEKKLMEREIDQFDEESGEEPDLSWLPDPDKVYGDKNNEEKSLEHNSNDEENVHEEIEVPVVKPKKKSGKHKNMEDLETHGPAKKKKKLEKIKQINSSLSVDQAEELALLLLKK